MPLTVYLNGSFIPYEQAVVPVEDRAFLLADGIYEVIRVYGGKPSHLAPHLKRLARSAHEVRMPAPDLAALERAARELVVRNDLREASIYIQISRGSDGPRTHTFPEGPIHPNVLIIARAVEAPERQWKSGIAAVTVPDQRWARCDIKSTALLANVLAKQAAHEAGADEAVFVRDGFAIEGSSSNFFAVLEGEIRTYPTCNYILGGITRDVVLAAAREAGFTVREEGVPVGELARASELWVTSTTIEVMPIVRLDGRQVGDGRPGPVAAAVHAAYRKKVLAGC